MAKDKKRTPKEIYWERKHREEREKTALLPPGFVNHGNTCFMNSVLQGLVSTDLLEDLVQFRPGTLRPSGSHRSPLLTNGRGPEKVRRDWVQGMAIGDAFVHILERSWRMRDAKERGSVSPRELLSRLGAKYDQYLDFRQQDAHEFLLHLLDGMRMEELDIIKQRQPPPPRKSRSSIRTHSVAHPPATPTPEEERLTSCVDMAFGGKLASVLICETCKHISHTLESFDDLSLSINQEEAKERMRVRLRTLASKFMSSSHRSRDQVTSRPLSFSQPPSPPLSATTLDIPENPQEGPRRRSLEAPSSLDLIPEIPKIDIFAGFGGPTDAGAVGENPIHKSRVPSRKASEAALGKLGRRISVGITMSGKKDKRSTKIEREIKASIPEYLSANGKDNGLEKGKILIPASDSMTPPRLSQKPAKKTHLEQSNRAKLSEHEALKSVYLHRLLEEPAAMLSNPLPLLRTASPISPGVSPPWPKLGSVRSIEDCLKMFTAVEVLDGDNMFGCRNCWKMANGVRPAKPNTQSDVDSESSEDDEMLGREDFRLQPEIADAMHSFSTPKLSPGVDATSSNSSRSTTSMLPFVISIPTVSVEEAIDLGSSDLSHGTPFFTPSFGADPSQAGGTTTDNKPSIPPTSEEKTFPHLPSEPRPYGIPIISAISPPSDGYDSESPSALHAERKTVSPNRPQNNHFPGQLDMYATASPHSLKLPTTRAPRHREATGDGTDNLSSEESEYDDTSGVSDGDVSGATVLHSAESRHTSEHGLPRSKQVVYRRALKRYLIAYPPPVLIVHLKRFQQMSKSPVTLFGNLKKLDEYVSFPEFLDIRRFLAPRKEDYGLGKGGLRGKVMEKGGRAEDEPCVYRLYTVVVHIGNMLGGHYVAYTALPKTTWSNPQADCGTNGSASKEQFSSNGEAAASAAGSAVKNERQWCYISDTVVRLASLDEVLASKAYICMYERMP